MAEETGLLDSGATENFIDHATVIRLHLGTKKLNPDKFLMWTGLTIDMELSLTHATS